MGDMRSFWILPVLLLLFAAPPALAQNDSCAEPAHAGVDWRRCYHDGRDLTQNDLSAANLREATFQRSDLSGSNLKGANAYRAKFISAVLKNVSFEGADLIEADFTKADLTGASLKGADLRRARFYRATLKGADLTGARLTGADFLYADLTGARWTDGQHVCAEGSLGQCN